MPLYTHIAQWPPEQVAKRVVCLVPSITELLYDIGLDAEVVGITRFCERPGHWLRTKTRVGGTKDVKLPIVHGLQPDLIIANKEENVREQILDLAATFPVWLTDVKTLEDALHMICDVGTITGKRQAANQIILQIRRDVYLPQHTQPPLRVAYLIWKNPWMAAGGDTFIHDMLLRAGFVNHFGHLHRYPVVNELLFAQPGPDIVLLSSEPFPFRDKHIAELKDLLPACRIVCADGAIFSWYGSRLLAAPGYFRQLQQSIKEAV